MRSWCCTTFHRGTTSIWTESGRDTRCIGVHVFSEKLLPIYGAVSCVGSLGCIERIDAKRLARSVPTQAIKISHSKIDTSTARNMVLSRGLLGRAGAAIATSILLGGGRTELALRYPFRYVDFSSFAPSPPVAASLPRLAARYEDVSPRGGRFDLGFTLRGAARTARRAVSAPGRPCPIPRLRLRHNSSHGA